MRAIYHRKRRCYYRKNKCHCWWDGD